MWKKADKQDDKALLVGTLTQEIQALESTIRQLLGAADRRGSLMLVIIGGLAAFAAQTRPEAALPAAAIAAVLLMTVVAMHLNSTLEAASLGELRDTLAWRANELLGEKVFLTGVLGKRRRVSFTSLATNGLVMVVIVIAWYSTISLAAGTRWFNIAVTGAVASLVVFIGGGIELVRVVKGARSVLRIERPHDRAWK